MKNIVFTFAVIALAASCNKNKTEHTTTSKNDTVQIKKDSLQIIVDSLVVEDSARYSKNFSAEYRQKILTFKGLQKQVLDSLYLGELLLKEKPMHDYTSENIKMRMTENMKKYLSDNAAEKEYADREYAMTWDQVSDMKVFAQTKDFLTVNYNGYGFSGGAHGYGYDLYKTVDLKKQTILQLSDFIEISKLNWKPVLLKHADKEMLFDENISANDNFYFDNQSITFVYNQYEIGPYAAGIIEIKVPFSEIKQYLKPEFQKRLNIN
ncbi:hypothetical protein ASG31_06655 [Chryseobacterium sp. Leaf404]|uniref:DUF3298 and DUF4163 domain-containing protein n=1 Tax=unclassified Chryseobacterium TaxID=2593645 RepID=UPI0006F50C54|nr:MULTISPECIES: DUF3298 and DUF4163 domain-containing protein [unclassified Chryseobacterium]KQT18398.1 hypothetical protein ASG31_06655 [Chryseobacterium sp. Leaf404]